MELYQTKEPAVRLMVMAQVTHKSTAGTTGNTVLEAEPSEDLTPAF